MQDRSVGGFGGEAVGGADLGSGATRSGGPGAPVRPPGAAGLVSRRDDPAHGLGRASRALADEEERGANLLLVQQHESPLGPDRIGAVVEGEGDAAVGRRAPPGGAPGPHAGAPPRRGPGPARAKNPYGSEDWGPQPPPATPPYIRAGA